VPVGSLEAEEQGLLTELLAGNATTVGAEVPGAWIQLQKITQDQALEWPDDRINVSMGDEGAEVSLPLLLLARVTERDSDGLVLVASAYARGAAETVALGAADATGAEAAEVLALVSARIVLVSTGAEVTVTGLAEPVIVILPVNRSTGARCFFWNESTSAWSEEGLRILEGPPDSLLSCSTTHLTLFSAIVHGAMKSLACSRISLLSGQSVGALDFEQWAIRPAAMALWCMLAALLLLFLLAASLDRHRRSQWSDEHFLAPNGALGKSQAEPAGNGPSSRPASCWPVCGSCGRGGGNSAADGQQRSASNNKVDLRSRTYSNLSSRWRSEVVNLRNKLAPTNNQERSQNQKPSLAMRALAKYVNLCSLVVTSAALWINPTDTKYFLDEGAPTLDHPEDMASGSSASSLDHMEISIAARAEEVRRELCTWRRLPVIMFQVFAAVNPIGKLLVRSIFMPSSLRALIVSCRVLGSVAVETAFFVASGGAECRAEGVGERLGRLLVTGTASAVLGRLPTLALARLHRRSFRHAEAADREQARRQLRAWRRRDAAIWALGLAYGGLCTYFVAGFVASMAWEDEQEDWLIGAGVALAQHAAGFPLLKAILLPLSVLLLLSLGGLARGAPGAALHEELWHDARRVVVNL